MVMEPPAPQPPTVPAPPELDVYTLGREFVRQYYTMLNQAPHLLYRFYSEDSSLIHGLQNEAVYGLREIGVRFQSLGFRDCHAKIRQVDSLETLDKGVVVQVTGELSNNGQHMRRFFQTIVLAPKSPTNYYVKNDIFRYLDETFVDDDEEVASEVEKAEVDAPSPVSTPAKAPTPTTTNIELTQASATPVKEPVSVETPPKQINGHPEEKALPTPTIEINTAKAPESTTPQQQTPQGAKNEPISWAFKVLKGGAPHTTPPVVASKPEAPVTIPFPVVPPSVTPSGKSPNDQAKPKKFGSKKFEREGSAFENDFGDERKIDGRFGDDHQLFVGNLPQDITEEELRTFFSKYGNILDIRINRTNQKSGGGRTPNYGFVTFDDARVVKKILSEKPIYLITDGQKHRINVEEKRSVGRSSGGAGGINRIGSGSGVNNSGFGSGPNFRGKRGEDGPGRRQNRPSFGDKGSGGGGGGNEGKNPAFGNAAGGITGNRPSAKRS